MRGDGRVFQKPGSSRWWIAFYINGKEHRESAGKTCQEARRRLRERIKQIQGDRFIGPKEERITIPELLDSLIVHLETKGAKSITPLRSHIRPVREYFSLTRATDLTTAAVERYIAERLSEGRARATINRELQAVQQACNLARKDGRLSRAPFIPRLHEENARQGFFEKSEFLALVALLPEPIDEVTRFAYFSGWRKGEILTLRWNSVDRLGREVRLTTSKTGFGRLLPLDGELWELMQRRWNARRFILPNGMVGLSDYVFHRKGKPVGEFRKSWATACKKAGIPGKLFHDLRRTAIRNMIRAGVPQSVAMAISGHRTISTFLRYNITSDDDRREAIRRSQAHFENSQVSRRTGTMHSIANPK